MKRPIIKGILSNGFGKIIVKTTPPSFLRSLYFMPFSHFQSSSLFLLAATTLKSLKRRRSAFSMINAAEKVRDG